VFIVHGHDEVLRLEVEKVVRGLGLNAIVLKDQANEGMTLIQKFEKNSDNVCFVIVLLTADDESFTKKDGNRELHARQNVVFEMGYFFHVFKSANGTHRGLFAILENGVTKPGDVDGLVYQPYIKGDRSWILSLIKELDAAGVDFDRAKIPSIL
jgi:predicted nucleotide-binding protein